MTNICHDKHVFCRDKRLDKHTFVVTKDVFVATKIFTCGRSRQ